VHQVRYDTGCGAGFAHGTRRCKMMLVLVVNYGVIRKNTRGVEYDQAKMIRYRLKKRRLCCIQDNDARKRNEHSDV